MIISMEKWNTLTCRQVFELMHRYNGGVKLGEDRFYFHPDGLFAGRLTKGTEKNPGITFSATKQTFDSDNLVKDVIPMHQLLRIALRSPADYV